MLRTTAAIIAAYCIIKSFPYAVMLLLMILDRAFG